MTGPRDPAGAGARTPRGPRSSRRRALPRIASGFSLHRAGTSVPAVLQITVAAIAAFLFAREVLGHDVPLLAVVVSLSSLGFVRDARPARVLETAVGMILGIAVAEETLVGLGWPAGPAFASGLVELGCVLLYVWPRTSVLGAVLTMALLGGAMATQLRVGSPLFSHILFSVYLGLFLWGGLWLRDPALRAIFPLRR